MFERFTSRARAVMVLAQVESRALNHNHIGTEHILLGLIHEGEGVAAQALESLGISLEAVRQQVQETIGVGKQSRAPSGHIPFTPRAKKVLELSLREALHLGHNYIGTEHVLLGLIREGEGVAAQVLVGLGADHDRVRAEVVHLLVGREGAEPAPASEGPASEGPASEGPASEGPASEGQAREGQAREGQAREGQAREGQAREGRLGRLLRPATIGSTRLTAAVHDVSIADALEVIGERLSAIEAQLGIAGHDAHSQPELESELARLTSLLREHGIDPG